MAEYLSRHPSEYEGSVAKAEELFNGLLSDHAPMQTNSELEKVKIVDKQLIEMAEAKDVTKSKISSVYVVNANAENDRTTWKVINLVLNKNTAVIARLPPPWREKFNSFSVASNGLLYMDHRLVITKDMRENMLRAIHFGHAGRDAMLREASEVWWPRIDRKIIEKARNCRECRVAGKNFKCIKSQREFGKLPPANQLNEEFSLDFAGPFQNAN